MIGDFSRLRTAKVMIARNVMRDVALLYVQDGNNLDLSKESLQALIKAYFIQDFSVLFNLVQTLQSRNQDRPPVWEQYYDHCVALRLGGFSNLFDDG